MSRIRSLLQSHPLPAYFILTFAISWGGILTIVGTRIPATASESDALFPAVYLAMLAGPVMAGLLMTAAVHGRDGFHDLLARLFTWRVGFRWYAVALLTAPAAALLTLAALATSSSAFVPSIFGGTGVARTLGFGLVVGLGAGIFEELGWTGFAVPLALRRRSPALTGLAVGVLWGAWHFLAVWWGSGGSSPLPPALLVPVALFSFLPPFRILMVWVYARTHSLLVAMLMHASLTASMIIIVPMGTPGWVTATYDLALATVLWSVAVYAATQNAAVRSMDRSQHAHGAHPR